MRTAITLGYDAAGKTTLLAGPETPADQQRAALNKLQGRPPKGLVRVELWMSDRGRARKITSAAKPKPATPEATPPAKPDPETPPANPPQEESQTPPAAN